jgi:hypothetical protein
MNIPLPKLEVGKSYVKRTFNKDTEVSNVRTIVSKTELWDSSFAYEDQYGKDYEQDGSSFGSLLGHDDDLVIEVIL